MYDRKFMEFSIKEMCLKMKQNIVQVIKVLLFGVSVVFLNWQQSEEIKSDLLDNTKCWLGK